MNITKGYAWKRKTRDFMDETHLLSPDSTVADNNKSKKKNKKKKKKITQSRSKAKRYALITFEELPEYMKDNEYILNYYRANWPLKEALFSIVRWHNETLNVWTHLIGFVLFLGLTVANLMHMPQVRDFLSMFIRSFPMTADTNVSHNSKDIFLETTKLIDLKQTTSPEMEIPSLETAAARWPFYIFLAGSMFCLLSSSICHLFSCHSHHLNLFLVRIDYIGITVMIITSFFPPIYYIFQCNTHWQFIYLTGITIMGTFTIVTMLSPSLSTSKYRPFRVFLFMAMGLFGIVPAIHGLIVNWNEPQQNITLAYESVMALCYMIGTIFYVSRIPERWKPGWFDLAGHSHQIFHLFVIFGALAHYGAALVFLEYGHKVSNSTIETKQERFGSLRDSTQFLTTGQELTTTMYHVYPHSQRHPSIKRIGGMSSLVRCCCKLYELLSGGLLISKTYTQENVKIHDLRNLS